jgi:hypothetical protein
MIRIIEIQQSGVDEIASAFIAVGSGDDLEVVPARIIEVDAATTIVGVDLVGLPVT